MLTEHEPWEMFANEQRADRAGSGESHTSRRVSGLRLLEVAKPRVVLFGFSLGPRRWACLMFAAAGLAIIETVRRQGSAISSLTAGSLRLPRFGSPTMRRRIREKRLLAARSEWTVRAFGRIGAQAFGKGR
jgi:hypothetical protein